MMVALATLSFMLVACGNKQANQVQSDEDQANGAVEEQVEEVMVREGEIEDDGVLPEDCKIPAIRDTWASKKLTGVAVNGKTDIGLFTLAFGKAYSDYEPNKCLIEYLNDPTKYDIEKADYEIVDKKNNGYLSCYMKRDLDWSTVGCYWNRNNGHKLVGLWLAEDHLSFEKVEQLLVFYDYDPGTDTMTPEPDLCKKVLEKISQYDSYYLTLPAEGKDIAATCYYLETKHDHAEQAYYMLRWNGYDFRLEKVNEIE